MQCISKINKLKSKMKRYTLIICIFILFTLINCSSDNYIPPSPMHFFEKGNIAFDERDYQTAIWNYQKAIHMDKNTSEYHYNLGLAFYETGNYKNAIKAFKNAHKVNPSNASVFYNIALSYNKLYRSDLAHKYYNKYQSILKSQRKKEVVPARNTPPPVVKSEKQTPSSQNKKPIARNDRKNTKNQIPKWDR